MNRLPKVLWLTVILLVITPTLVSGFEQALVENLCETPIDGAGLLEGAVDGSKYYRTNEVMDLPGLLSDSMDLLVWSMDIRFDQEGAGFTPMGADEKMGTCIRSHTRRKISISSTSRQYCLHTVYGD